jgi:WD40 repeat protein
MITLARFSFGMVLFFSGTLLSNAGENPVSFANDLMPVFRRSCTGCHQPAKMKGQLDLTTFASLQQGGKHGPAIHTGDPQHSRLLDEISGDEPNMPKEGDPLSKAEVALIQRWIAEGAKDDTPVDANSFKLKEPPVYHVAPVVSALAFSPAGHLLAVSGYHEVLLRSSDGSKLLNRLVGEAPRIESIAFSPDGKRLAVSGGAPARFGEIQVWDVAAAKLVSAVKISPDCLYGVSFSPDGQKVAFGCTDKTVRMLQLSDGKEILKVDSHSDWVLATTFSLDGKRLLSGSRDRAMKLLDATSGQFIDDINKLLEGVLCMARHPKRDEAVYGGDLGGIRIYRMAENQQRTAANNDFNLLREFERQPGPVRAVAFSPDGSLVAAGGGFPDVPIYKTSDGSRVATLRGQEGAIFTLAFHPNNGEIATGGYDGSIRLYEASSGKLITTFIPVPIEAIPHQQVAAASPSH